MVRGHPSSNRTRACHAPQPVNTPALHASRPHPPAPYRLLHTTFADWYQSKRQQNDSYLGANKQNKTDKTPPPNLPAGVLVTLCLGRKDPESPLARLSGHDDVLRTIIQLLQEWCTGTP